MFALACLSMMVAFICFAVSEYEKDFIPGVFLASLLSVVCFILFCAQIAS